MREGRSAVTKTRREYQRSFSKPKIKVTRYRDKGSTQRKGTTTKSMVI